MARMPRVRLALMDIWRRILVPETVTLVKLDRVI